MGQNRAAKLTQRLKLHPPLSCTRLSSRLLPVTHDMRPNERSPLHKKPPHYLQGSINAASRLEPRIPPDLSVTRWTTRCSSIIVRRTPSEKTSSQKRPGCPRCMNGAASPLKTRHFYHHPLRTSLLLLLFVTASAHENAQWAPARRVRSLRLQRAPCVHHATRARRAARADML